MKKKKKSISENKKIKIVIESLTEVVSLLLAQAYEGALYIQELEEKIERLSYASKKYDNN